MNEEQGRQNLIDATDCLEAIGVLRGWKNFLFIITILCLLLLQGSFWLVNTGFVKAESETETTESSSNETILPPATVTPPAANEPVAALVEASAQQTVAKPNEVEVAAEEAAVEKAEVAEINEPVKAAPAEKQFSLDFNINFNHLSWLIRFINFVLIPVVALYCLTMLFALKVSLLGRLGGINHICRAFFLSLVFVVLLLPWQRFFGGIVAGAMYTPAELLSSYTASQTAEIFEKVFYYLRFTVYWAVVLLVLIFSQVRSVRWAKATLQRLEVI